MSIGASVHPSPSAQDGRVIEQSTYIKKSDKLDNKIQCAQCGFMVDLDKRSTGDSLGAIGNPTFTTQTFTPPRGKSQTDTFGDPVDTKAGCPFCNTLNPRAVGRDSDPFWKVNTDISNL